MNIAKTWTLLAFIVVALCIFGPWLDQPSDADAERAVADTVADAQADECAQQRQQRAEVAMAQEVRP
jgi:hypothetical protein